LTFKNQLSGACILAALLCLMAGLVPQFVPSANPLGAMARMFDAVPFWLLGSAALFGVVAAIFGARWLGAGLVLAAAVGAGTLIVGHRALSLPVTPMVQADLRIVWHNIYSENPLSADTYMAAIQALDPDIVILAEPDQLLPHVAQYLPSFTQVTPCWFEPCDLLIATHLDVRRHWLLSLNPVFGLRYGVIEVDTNSGKTVFISIAHLLKPWMSGVSEPEWARLIAQYNWLSGPAVAVGDYNTAPWSRPMRELLNETGFRAVRRPPGTWPTQAGRWGLPIDQVLVKGGARVVSVTPFGETLGSNHRGLIIDIALPPQP
jgi:endonuclease/exonuclease/phosphatase (EEP) superfamily protein YafD